MAVVAAGAAGASTARAVERNFAGSAQLDYFAVPPSETPSALAGFTSEVALKVAVDVSDRLSANVKVCHGCHGFELPFAYFDYRLADELNFRVGRFSPSFGNFNVRHDPANHLTSSKPLPYDMGRMLRWSEWNLGVIPSPFPDNGIEVNGTHWFGERAAVEYAVYAVPGFRAPEGALDLAWGQSLSLSPFMVDNNSRPTAGGRAGMTLRFGDANDLAVGGSVMYGPYDPANRFYYLIAGGDLAARFGRTQIRAEYLIRHQTFAADPAVAFQLPVPASGIQTFDKHGYYLEVERSMSDIVGLLLRADGLYRSGNVPVGAPLAPRSAIFRYTAAATVVLTVGLRLKASFELWAFSNDIPQHQDWAAAGHLAMVATF
jgi:hypothetical protein